MILTPWNSRRRVVPRWRTLELTLQSGELKPLAKTTDKADDGIISQELAKRLARWRADPSLMTAAELVETAIVDGRENEAVKAATRLIQIDERAAPLVKHQAARLLARVGQKKPWLQAHMAPPAAIALWRERTRTHPNDALAWIELALHQTIIGKQEAAGRSVAVAMQFAPDNRHVLRSAVRYYLHVGERDRAHDILLRSAATNTDPWLLAAEIATAEIAERSPKLSKIAAKMLSDGGLYPRQITEMASAIGTLELVDGNRKKARRAFEHSLVDPNGNVAAQAEWASPAFGDLLIKPQQLAHVAEPAEALAFHRYGERRYLEVLKFCDIWATEEPYSIRPYEFGAAAAGAAGDYQSSIEFAGRGLRQRPGSPKLSNSLAFALASLDRTAEASAALDAIKLKEVDERAAFVILANRGLIAYRRGQLDEGASRYREAAEGFKKLGEKVNEAHAQIYHARESRHANEAGHEKLLHAAKQAWSKLDRHPNPVIESMEVVRSEPKIEEIPQTKFSASHQFRLI